MKPIASLFTLALVAMVPTWALADTHASSHEATHHTSKKDAPAPKSKVAAKVAPKKHGLDKVALKRAIDHALTERHAETHTEPTEIELAKLAEDSRLETLPKPKSLTKVSTKKEIHPSTKEEKSSEKTVKAHHAKDVLPSNKHEKVAPKHEGSEKSDKKESASKRHSSAKDVPADGKIVKVAAKTEIGEKAAPHGKVSASAADEVGPDMAGRCGLDLVLRHDGKEEIVPVKTCDGKLVAGALDKVAVLVGETKGHDGLDPRLLTRVGEMAAHFGKKGKLPEIEILGGAKNANSSMHKDGRALDVRFVGVKNEDVAAFCKTLEDTGCGFYPNGKFVHVDVRDAGTGKVSWIDVAAPGEAPRYVANFSEKPAKSETAEKSEKRVAPKAEKRDGKTVSSKAAKKNDV